MTTTVFVVTKLADGQRTIVKTKDGKLMASYLVPEKHWYDVLAPELNRRCTRDSKGRYVEK